MIKVDCKFVSTPVRHFILNFPYMTPCSTISLSSNVNPPWSFGGGGGLIYFENVLNRAGRLKEGALI